MNRRQHGVALITAMLIVAIIAVVATSLALAQQVWLRQTQNLTDLAQAERLRRGALEFAAAVLVRDARNSRSDDLTEEWAQPIPPLPVEGGAVAISIADAQARFNLNNLLVQTPAGQPNPHMRLLENLLALNELPPLGDALLDWLDNDSNVRPDGAEDLDYLNHDPPYRAANRALTSVDELRLIKGFTAEIVEKLRPYVVALPLSAGPTPVNVNTAPAPVLAALVGVDAAQAEQLVNARANTPFKQASEFQKWLQSLSAGGQAAPGSYDVSSRYFIVSVDSRIGRTQRRTVALIERITGANPGAWVWWYREPPLPIVLDSDEDNA